MDISVLPQHRQWEKQDGAPEKSARQGELFAVIYADKYGGIEEEPKEIWHETSGEEKDVRERFGAWDRQSFALKSATIQCPVIGGLGMVGSGAGLTVYYAVYAADSTEDNPIVEVHMREEASGKNGVYRVSINEIDPRNASRMEMYAYCAHMDSQNGVEISDMANGSCYAMRQTGLFETEGLTAEDFREEKRNWLTAVEEIHAHIVEGLEKIRNGEVEEKILIGGLKLTQREWKQLLDILDKLMDAMDQSTEEEAAQEQERLTGPKAGKYLREHKAAEIAGTKPEILDGRDALDLLLAESTRAFVASERADEAAKLHIVNYTKEGIYCREAGQTQEVLWFIPFSDESQYEKVLTFVRGLADEEDVGFTADQYFWMEFLGHQAYNTY